MTGTAAYALRRRADAQSFRVAWDSALDYAVRRLSDAAFARALHGVARPVFYKGEQVGERRYFDERLTMFLLKARDPARYGAWRDRFVLKPHPERAALDLADKVDRLELDAFDEALGKPLPPLSPGEGDDDQATT